MLAENSSKVSSIQELQDKDHMRDAGIGELCNLQPIIASIIHNYLWSFGQLFGFLKTSIIYFLILISIIGFLKPNKVFALYFLLFGFPVWLVSIANILHWEYKMLWIVNWIIAAWAGEGIMRPVLWARSELTAEAARPRHWPGLKSVQWQPPSVAESRVTYRVLLCVEGVFLKRKKL